MSDFYLPSNADNESIIRNIGRTIRGLDTEIKWHINIKPFKAKRSIYQNNYYWGVMLLTIKNWYHETRGKAVSEKALHEEFKEVYCPYTEEQGSEGLKKVYKSTSNLTTTEFNDMTDRMIADFADFGCHIPSPDKNWRDR